MTILAAFRIRPRTAGRLSDLTDHADFDTEEELVEHCMEHMSRDGEWLYGIWGLLAFDGTGEISERIFELARAAVIEQAQIDAEEAHHIRQESMAGVWI